jgi:hypothetical protein
LVKNKRGQQQQQQIDCNQQKHHTLAPTSSIINYCAAAAAASSNKWDFLVASPRSLSFLSSLFALLPPRLSCVCCVQEAIAS